MDGDTTRHGSTMSSLLVSQPEMPMHTRSRRSSWSCAGASRSGTKAKSSTSCAYSSMALPVMRAPYAPNRLPTSTDEPASVPR